MTACLFTDDTVLLAESESELQRVVDKFHSMCSRRKLRRNVTESKVMVFERKEVKMVNFGNLYRVSVSVIDGYEIVLEDERIEVVKQFKYSGTMLSKHGEMEEVRKRAVKGRSVTGSLSRVMKGNNVSMEVKKGLRNSILLLTLTYGSEMLTWNRALQSRVHAVEISCLRGACGVTR